MGRLAQTLGLTRTMPLLPPMGKADEIRLRAEMADWSDSELIAAQIKAPGLARDVAAQQIRHARAKEARTRQEAEAKTNNLKTALIGIAGLLVGSIGTFYTYRAYVQQNQSVQPASQPSQTAGSGAHMPASASTLSPTTSKAAPSSPPTQSANSPK